MQAACLPEPVMHATPMLGCIQIVCHSCFLLSRQSHGRVSPVWQAASGHHDQGPSRCSGVARRSRQAPAHDHHHQACHPGFSCQDAGTLLKCYEMRSARNLIGSACRQLWSGWHALQRRCVSLGTICALLVAESSRWLWQPLCWSCSRYAQARIARPMLLRRCALLVQGAVNLSSAEAMRCACRSGCTWRG